MKMNLTKITTILGIVGSLYAFGVWSGIMWVTQNEFMAFRSAQANEIEAQQRRLQAVERTLTIDRVLELLDKREAQAGTLDGNDLDELCTKADILTWEVEGCKD